MIVFPNAKINLGLNVVARRSDGYHEIETVFYPIPWCDALEINESEVLDFQSTGIPIPGVEAENLCVKAYNMINKVFHLKPVNIHLQKNIPIGAGLGGGSADGSFMLTALNQCFKLNLSNEQLRLMAEKLGADCPFFIENKPVFATGIGDEFEEVNVDLSGKKLVVVYPKTKVETPWAYRQITPKKAKFNTKEIVGNYPISNWKEYLINDFEEPIFEAFPRLRDTKTSMYMNNAIYAAMSGSGSSIFGIFDANENLDNLELTFSNKSYIYRILNL